MIPKAPMSDENTGDYAILICSKTLSDAAKVRHFYVMAKLFCIFCRLYAEIPSYLHRRLGMDFDTKKINN